MSPSIQTAHGMAGLLSATPLEVAHHLLQDLSAVDMPTDLTLCSVQGHEARDRVAAIARRAGLAVDLANLG